MTAAAARRGPPSSPLAAEAAPPTRSRGNPPQGRGARRRECPEARSPGRRRQPATERSASLEPEATDA
eukprot:3515088-Alexandrium_andersonii.AAC.1